MTSRVTISGVVIAVRQENPSQNHWRLGLVFMAACRWAVSPADISTPLAWWGVRFGGHDSAAESATAHRYGRRMQSTCCKSTSRFFHVGSRETGAASASEPVKYAATVFGFG